MTGNAAFEISKKTSEVSKNLGGLGECLDYAIVLGLGDETRRDETRRDETRREKLPGPVGGVKRFVEVFQIFLPVCHHFCNSRNGLFNKTTPRETTVIAYNRQEVICYLVNEYNIFKISTRPASDYASNNKPGYLKLYSDFFLNIHSTALKL